MISLKEVETMIKNQLPDAQVKVIDLKNGADIGDHLEAIVVSSAFEGKRTVQQHQLVNKAVKEALNSGAIHALALKTYTPEAWIASQG